MSFPLSSLGVTRSDIKPRHALLTPESHEWITQPEWPGAELAWLVSPDLGAKLAMGLVRVADHAEGAPAAPGIARFIFCLDGQLDLSNGASLPPESYVFLPPDADTKIFCSGPARFALFEWNFLARGAVPASLCGTLSDIPGMPLRGDDQLRVQKMLPTDPAFDFEVNVMTFEPGASLAYVETHFMEHGLLMLDGGGIYRLDNHWYPVTAGDAIWMGPHVPQWFGALGRKSSRYLICKNYNRSPMSVR